MDLWLTGICLVIVALIGLLARTMTRTKKRKQQATERPKPPYGWMIGNWPFTLICRRKGHQPGPWRDTFQPHVLIRDCNRCGAFECRTRIIGPYDPKRLP